MNLLAPERQPDEFFEAYKLRRLQVKKMVQAVLVSTPKPVKGGLISFDDSKRMTLKDAQLVAEQLHNGLRANNP